MSWTRNEGGKSHVKVMLIDRSNFEGMLLSSSSHTFHYFSITIVPMSFALRNADELRPLMLAVDAVDLLPDNFDFSLFVLSPLLRKFEPSF